MEETSSIEELNWIQETNSVEETNSIEERLVKCYNICIIIPWLVRFEHYVVTSASFFCSLPLFLSFFWALSILQIYGAMKYLNM